MTDIRQQLRQLEMGVWNWHKIVAESEDSPPTLATEALVAIACAIRELAAQPPGGTRFRVREAGGGPLAWPPV